jgi:hypothetical protein
MRRLLILAALAPLAACQSEPQLATLTDNTPETIATLTGVLASAVGRAKVQLGPLDVLAQPVVSVLPPPAGPLEGNSPAMPVLFDIVLFDGDCYVRAQESAELFLLAGLGCVPVDPAP